MNNIPTVYPVTCHTKHVGPGSTFVAIKGYEKDGADFIPDAIAKGATTIIIGSEVHLHPQVLQLTQEHEVELQEVADPRLALAQLSAQAADYPAAKLKIIGITGTKGKTTTSFLLAHLLKSAGHKTALLSTVNNYVGDQKFDAPLTTAQPDYLHQFLKLCVEQGVTHVVMEVAAQALSLHRVHGIQFDGVIFTNFSLEHLEFYPDMDTYFAAKCQIFGMAKPDTPILINGDDEWCRKISLVENMFLFSADSEKYKTVRPELIEGHSFNLQGLENTVRPEVLEGYSFSCPALIGSFNAYNATAAATMALKLGVSRESVDHGLATFTGVRGRFERHELANGALCIIDYAHNPSSYESVLGALRVMTDHLIVVFGAGGKRDPSKRPIMGGLAAQFADVAIITSDNPRTEDPGAIMADIERGIAAEHVCKVIKLSDRKQAIERAYGMARVGSIIALLGKGPDEYQIIGDQKQPFSEAEIIESLSNPNNGQDGTSFNA